MIAVPKETAPGERRVALVPEVVRALVKDGFQVAVETGAGRREAAGMNFSGAPFPATSRPVAWRAAAESPSTGTGRREIGGVRYEASPPSGGSTVPGGQKTGAAMRKITGVDITAVPPSR